MLTPTSPYRSKYLRPSRGARPVGGRRNRRNEIVVLRSLWHRQREIVAAECSASDFMSYLDAHFAIDLTIERHLAVIDLMIPYIQGRVLEWGCHHAPDSCVYRLRLGEAVELFGCDVAAPGQFRTFHEYSGLTYAQVRHPYRLDYDDAFFDVVTSNGVLEHVPDDWNSVREIRRVLKPGGTFVITCLPNRFSYTEAIQRRLGNTAHERLYTIGGIRRMLLDAGFEVLSWRYLFLVPTMLNGFPSRLKAAYQRAHAIVWAVNTLLERTWPINRLASNLMIVARNPGHD